MCSVLWCSRFVARAVWLALSLCENNLVVLFLLLLLLLLFSFVSQASCHFWGGRYIFLVFFTVPIFFVPDEEEGELTEKKKNM